MSEEAPPPEEAEAPDPAAEAAEAAENQPEPPSPEEFATLQKRFEDTKSALDKANGEQGGLNNKVSQLEGQLQALLSQQQQPEEKGPDMPGFDIFEKVTEEELTENPALALTLMKQMAEIGEQRNEARLGHLFSKFESFMTERDGEIMGKFTEVDPRAKEAAPVIEKLAGQAWFDNLDRASQIEAALTIKAEQGGAQATTPSRPDAPSAPGGSRKSPAKGKAEYDPANPKHRDEYIKNPAVRAALEAMGSVESKEAQWWG